MASDGRIELELTVKDNASGQVNSIVSDIEHKVNRASGDVKIGLKASDEASKVIDEVKDKTEKGAEGKATLKADDQATSVINAAKENTEKGAEGKATIKADDQASDTIKTVREDYEKGAEGKATVTGDDEATATLTGVRTDYEKGAEGKATVTGADEATETLTSVRTDYERGAEGTATIKGDNTGACSAISEVQEALDNLSSTNPQVDIGGSSGSSGGASGGVGGFVKGVGNAAKNVMAGVFSAGMSYEDALAFASSYMPAYADADAYGHAMLDLASETGMDVSDLLGASYSALSARIKYGADEGDIGGSQLANFVGQAARVARIGQIDTNTAATVLAQMLNANGLAATDENVQRMGNILARGQEYGVNMGIGVQAGALSHVLPLWKMAGMDMEQGYAMLEGMTAGGTSFSEAVTQMRMVMLELMNETGDAGKAFKDATGMSFTDYLAGGGTIMDAITTLNTFGNGKLNDIFSNRNAIIGAGQMLNAGQFFEGNYAAMLDTGTDSVARQYGNVTATTSFSLSRIREQFKGYGAMLYDALAPAVHKVLGLVSGDKFQLAMARITNKIARFLESDALENLIDGLVNAAGSLLDVLNGKKSWGEFFSEITGGLKEVGDTVMRWLEDGVINIANEVLDGLPGWMTKGAHIETRSEREAREKKEEAYKQWQTENGLNTEGTYFTAADGSQYWVNSEDSVWLASLQDSMNGIIETNATLGPEEAAAAIDRWINEKAGDNNGLRRVSEEEANALNGSGFEAWYAGQLASEEQKAQNLGTLDQYDIYDAKSFSRLAGSAMRTQDPEAIGQLQDVLIAIGDLAAGGETGWWSKGAQDYSNGVASDESVAYAAIQSAADSAAASTEDAAAGMDDVARVSSRVSSSMSGLPGTLTSLATAAAYASGELSNVHYAGYLHAVGLDRVPYDNYPALLHKGEMVLTAAEASAFRFGGTGSAGGRFDVNGLASAIAGMAVQMDGKTVGRLVERSVSQEQGVRYNRQARKG